MKDAMKDPRNLDAWIQAATLFTNLNEAIDLLKVAEKQGRLLPFFHACLDVILTVNTPRAPIPRAGLRAHLLHAHG